MSKVKVTQWVTRSPIELLWTAKKLTHLELLVTKSENVFLYFWRVPGYHCSSTIQKSCTATKGSISSLKYLEYSKGLLEQSICLNLIQIHHHGRYNLKICRLTSIIATTCSTWGKIILRDLRIWNLSGKPPPMCSIEFGQFFWSASISYFQVVSQWVSIT